jgi:hypothetical protein
VTISITLFFKIQEYQSPKNWSSRTFRFLDFQYYEILHLDIKKPPSLTIVKLNHNVRDGGSLKKDEAAR